ncbi:ferredoxin [Salipiger sp.]|uniref:ferredoxin n=1 Tax=Salipiger sp. TaxID=2078585 RepID=UPI003A97C70C
MSAARDAVATAAREVSLVIRGALHDDGGTILLLGPDEPGFWAVFSASGEYGDGGPDPLDRWSKRVIRAIAAPLGGRAVFPSDGPPYPPFLDWAQAAGNAWPSPVGPLVHDTAGLLISYRGAIVLPGEETLTDARPPSPCPACPRPCATACPVGAMRAGQVYDVATCQSFLRTEEGRVCRTRGCRVRHACPASAAMRRTDQQAAFHMSAFMGSWPPPQGGTA